MAKKTVCQITRCKIGMAGVENAEHEELVKEPNKDFERTDKGTRSIMRVVRRHTLC